MDRPDGPAYHGLMSLPFDSPSFRSLGLPLALASVALVTTIPSAAQPAATCGNGYCDGWAGETPQTCPADCGKPTTPPPPAAAAEARYQLAPYPQYPQPWQVGAPVPLGFHTEERPVRGLLIGGGVVLGAGYLLGIVVGSFEFNNGGAAALVPVVGPFIAGSAYKASCAGLGCIASGVSDAFYKVPLYFAGGVQVIGAVLLIAGASVHRPILVRDAGLTIRPVPLAGKGIGGLGLEGTF